MQAALLAAAAGFCILLSPPPPAFQRPLICAEVRFIGSYAHILVNCDADSFIAFAEHPSRVLEEKSMRQTRPGYAVLGTALSIPFRVTGAFTGNPYYAGYVLLNFALLVSSALMLSNLIGVKSLLAPSALVPASILLVNHITKAFLWTPHQQVMGLFVSMLSIWIARDVISGRLGMTFRNAVITGLLTGIGCLVYGAFVLVPASITVALWIFRRRDAVTNRLASTIALSIGTALPFIAWRSFVIARTGSFYSHETEHYHEFVWTAERWREGTFVSALFENLGAFFQTFPRALALPVAFIAAAIALGISRNGMRGRGTKEPAIQASLCLLAAAVPFYGLMGFYDPRLTAALIPPLVVIAGTLTQNAFDGPTRSPIPEPITIAALAYVAIVILIPGPYA